MLLGLIHAGAALAQADQSPGELLEAARRALAEAGLRGWLSWQEAGGRAALRCMFFPPIVDETAWQAAEQAARAAHTWVGAGAPPPDFSGQPASYFPVQAPTAGQGVLCLAGPPPAGEARRAVQAFCSQLAALLERAQPLPAGRLLEAIADPAVLKDGAGRWQAANPAARQFFGLQDITWRGSLDQTLPGVDPALLEACFSSDERAWALSQNGRPRLFETLESYRTPSGGQRIFELRKLPSFDPGGARQALVTVIREVAAVHERQGPLASSRLQHEALLSALDESLYRISRAGVILDYRPGRSPLHAVDKSQLLDRSVLELFPPAQAQELMGVLTRCLATGLPQTWEFTDDEGPARRYFRARLAPCGSDEILMLAADQTELNQHALALLAAEDKFHSLVDQAVDGIVLADEQGTIVEWNAAQEKITGLPVEEVIGRKVWEVLALLAPQSLRTTEHAQMLRQLYEDYQSSGSAEWMSRVQKQTFQRPDGSNVDVEGVMFPIRTPNGYMSAAVNRDIGEQLRAAQAVERRANELAALYEFSIETASIGGLPQLLNWIVEHAVAMLGGTQGGLYLCDPLRQEARCVVSYQTPSDYTGVTLKYGVGVAGLVAQTGQPLLLDDYSAWEGRAEFLRTDPSFKSLISAPMVWRGQVQGVIQIYHHLEQGKFSPASLDLLRLLANQAAVALENARLLEAERRRWQEAETLRNATAALITSLDLNQVLEVLLQQMAQVVPYDSAAVFLVEVDHLEIVAAQGFPNPAEVIGQCFSVDDPLLARLNIGQPIILENANLEPSFNQWVGTSYVRGWMGVPFMLRGLVIGYLTLDSRQANAYTIEDASLAQAFANHAAVAFDNACLFHQMTTERRHLELVYDVGLALGDSLDNDAIMQRAIALTCQALGGVRGVAQQYLPDQERLRLVAMEGIDIASLAEIDAQLDLRPGKGLTGWVALHRQGVLVEDVAQDARWLHVPRLDDGVRSAVSAPILYQDQLLGVLSVYSDLVGAFDASNLTLLQAICQAVGLAMSNATRFEQIERRLAEITLIQSLAQTFTKRLELQELLDEVVYQLATRLGYPQAEIFLIEGERLVLRAFSGRRPDIASLALDEGIIGRVARTGAAEYVQDVSSDLDYVGSLPDIAGEIAAPIYVSKSVVGVINVQSVQPGQIDQQDLQLLELLAGQISIAMENAVLYERLRRYAAELEDTIARRTGELRILYELSQKIGGTASYEELLRLLLGQLQNAVRCDVALGCLALHGANAFIGSLARPLSGPGLDELLAFLLETLAQFNPGIDPAASGFSTPQLVESAGFDPAAPPIARLESRAALPVWLDGTLVGLVIIATEAPGGFSDEQRRLFETIVNHTANAVVRLTAQLAAEQRRLEALVEHLPVGVLLLEADQRLLVSNLLGRQALDALGAAITAGRLESLGGHPLQTLIARQTDPLPVELVVAGPPRQVFEVLARPAGQADQPQWVLTLADVTQERDVQARVQMHERLATVGQLAAGIAHDFNNIMAAILVYADLLHRDLNLPPASRDKLAIIQDQVERAASLIRQILDFSRRGVMERSVLDLLPFIKELEKMLGRILPETIRMELSFRPGVYLVNADPTRLQQVFMNLVLNARDAMPDGGVLRFELDSLHLETGSPGPLAELPPGDWIRVAVQDNGLGMSPDVLQYIFDPFFTTKPVGQGTGLGLSQVYGIVKNHGGYIDVNSAEGKGSRFSIYLPALNSPAPASGPLSEAQTLPLGNGETILLVEDDIATRQAMLTLLEAYQYKVIDTANGMEALSCFDANRGVIDLVVSDVVMPQMGGLALYRALQARRPDVRMLFVTGHPLQGEEQVLLEQGQVNWLQKPFTVLEFGRAVAGMLNA